MKKHDLKDIWLALTSKYKKEFDFYNPNFSGDQSYWNWDHRINPAGPYAALGNVSQLHKDSKANWISRGVKDKHPYLCLKSVEIEEFKNGDFFGPFELVYNKTLELCKNWINGSRYYRTGVCMKFFPDELTFPQAWKNCAEIDGYIPCPTSHHENKLILDELNAFLQPGPNDQLPEIWTSVMKIEDYWNCKDTLKSIDNFWGFYETEPTVKYDDKFQKFTHNYTDHTRTFNNGTPVDHKDEVSFILWEIIYTY